MKPLVHPAIEDVTVEGILYALSDPTRVAIFAEIAASVAADEVSGHQGDGLGLAPVDPTLFDEPGDGNGDGEDEADDE